MRPTSQTETLADILEEMRVQPDWDETAAIVEEYAERIEAAIAREKKPFACDCDRKAKS